MTPENIERTSGQVEGKELAPNSPKVFLVARLNSSYDWALPQVTKLMRVQGMNANLISYPAGTSPEEIKADLTNRWTDFRGSTMFTDATVGNLIRKTPKDQAQALDIAINPWAYHNEIILNKDGYPDAGSESLDARFNWLAIEAILGAEGVTSPSEVLDYQGSSDMEQTGKAVSATMRIAFGKGAPDEFYIVGSGLSEHSPFTAYLADIARKILRQDDIPSEYSGAYQLWPILKDLGIEGEDALFERASQAGMEFARPEDILREWILAAGYPAEKVKILREGERIDSTRRNVWAIGDRHNKEKDRNYSATIFETPFANLLGDMQKKGLVTPEDLPSAAMEDLALRVASELVNQANLVEPHKQKFVLASKESKQSEVVTLSPEPEITTVNVAAVVATESVETEKPVTANNETTAEPETPVLPKQSRIQRFFNKIRKSK